MSYRASAALAYEATAPAYGYGEPYLELVEGTLAQERGSARAASWTSVIQAVVCAVLAMLIIGTARVSIYTATVDVLQENSALRSDIRDAQALSGSLEVETTRLASSERIASIAVDTYGMVPAEDIEIIYVAGSSNPMSVSSVVAATGERVRAQGYVAYSASPSAGFSRTAQITYGTDHAVAAG